MRDSTTLALVIGFSVLLALGGIVAAKAETHKDAAPTVVSPLTVGQV